MPICIECSYPVPQLYHVLHSRPPRPPPGAPNIPPKPSTLASSQKDPGKPPAVPDDRRPKARKGAGGYGSDVRLTQCPRCKRFADKYVEYDYVVLFIDLDYPTLEPLFLPFDNFNTISYSEVVPNLVEGEKSI